MFNQQQNNPIQITSLMCNQLPVVRQGAGIISKFSGLE